MELTSQPIDVSQHDTYYYADLGPFYYGSGGIFLVFAFIQALFTFANYPLNKKLSMIHYLLTSIVLIAILIITNIDFTNIRRAGFENQDFSSLNYWITAVALFGLLSQLLLVWNIIISLYKNRIQ